MVVLSLGVGIGANTAIFSLVNGVLLRPLDYRQPERLVAISQSSPKFLKSYAALPITIGTLLEWRKQSSSFESIGAYRNAALSLTGSGEPEILTGAAVSANFFHVLGIAPRIGREFLESEDHAGQDHVVILADSLWRRRFQADAGIVGRKIMLDGALFRLSAFCRPISSSLSRRTTPRCAPARTWRSIARWGTQPKIRLCASAILILRRLRDCGRM